LAFLQLIDTDVVWSLLEDLSRNLDSLPAFDGAWRERMVELNESLTQDRDILMLEETAILELISLKTQQELLSKVAAAIAQESQDVMLQESNLERQLSQTLAQLERESLKCPQFCLKRLSTTMDLVQAGDPAQLHAVQFHLTLLARGRTVGKMLVSFWDETQRLQLANSLHLPLATGSMMFGEAGGQQQAQGRHSHWTRLVSAHHTFTDTAINTWRMELEIDRLDFIAVHHLLTGAASADDLSPEDLAILKSLRSGVDKYVDMLDGVERKLLPGTAAGEVVRMLRDVSTAQGTLLGNLREAIIHVERSDTLLTLASLRHKVGWNSWLVKRRLSSLAYFTLLVGDGDTSRHVGPQEAQVHLLLHGSHTRLLELCRLLLPEEENLLLFSDDRAHRVQYETSLLVDDIFFGCEQALFNWQDDLLATNGALPHVREGLLDMLADLSSPINPPPARLVEDDLPKTPAAPADLTDEFFLDLSGDFERVFRQLDALLVPEEEEVDSKNPSDSKGRALKPASQPEPEPARQAKPKAPLARRTPPSPGAYNPSMQMFSKASERMGKEIRAYEGRLSATSVISALPRQAERETAALVWLMRPPYPLPVPVFQEGVFSMANAYVVLVSTPHEGRPTPSCRYDVHVWMGAQCGPESCMAALCFAGMLEAHLTSLPHAAAVAVHRDYGGDASPFLRAYFHVHLGAMLLVQKIMPLYLSPKQAGTLINPPVVYHCTLSRGFLTWEEVQPSGNITLHAKDMYLLDTGVEVLAWKGADSPAAMTSKVENALSSLSHLRSGQMQARWFDSKSEGDDGFVQQVKKLGVKSCTIAGGSGKEVPPPVARSQKEVYLLLGNGRTNLIHTCTTTIPASLLTEHAQSGGALLIDCLGEVFVWIPRHLQVRKMGALDHAVQYLRQNGRPTTTPLTCLTQGSENTAFWVYFNRKA